MPRWMSRIQMSELLLAWSRMPTATRVWSWETAKLVLDDLVTHFLEHFALQVVHA